MYKTQKAIIAIIVIFAITFNTFPVLASDNKNPSGITILLDGETIDFDVPPFIENGHTFVPFRAIFEAFGLSVQYYEQTEQIYATLQTDKNSLQIWIDLKGKTISCEGVEYDPDVLIESKVVAGKMEPQKVGSVSFYKDIDVKTVNDRTFVPARVIAESLGCRVDWGDNTKTVIITSENAVITGDENYAGLPTRVALDRSGIAEAKSAKFREDEDEIIRLVNEARVDKGWNIPKQDDSLTKLARQKAREMADTKADSISAGEKETLLSNTEQPMFYVVTFSINKTVVEFADTITHSIFFNAPESYPSEKEAILAGAGGAKAEDGTIYYVYISMKPFDNSVRTALENEVIRLVNEERVKSGLTPFIENEELAKVARLKAQDMADNGYCTHLSPTYGYPADMVQNYAGGVNFSGEDVAAGQMTPYAVFTDWMNSSGHRDIILMKEPTYIGVGVSLVNGVYKWVLMTGKQN
ncbi:MAG: stalk domain-containing protein [Oscillospiraceae bacterium]|nr:stalk domain-containing protein [Oscillospiraceae bacterium]